MDLTADCDNDRNPEDDITYNVFSAIFKIFVKKSLPSVNVCEYKSLTTM